MDLYHSTTKSCHYKHLSYQERVYIEIRLSEGMKPCSIAKLLGRAKNTVLSEIRRGTVTQIKQGKQIEVYLADTGQAIYEKHRKACRPAFKIAKCQAFIEYVTTTYNGQGWSLDAITGYVKQNMPHLETVCTKTLYNYVDRGLLPIKNIDLPVKVKRNNKRQKVRQNMKNLGTSIDERPDISKREAFGHWEIDTVVGLKKKDEPALLTLVERKTRFQICLKIKSKTDLCVQEALQRLKKHYGQRFSSVFKTITSDNGSEFASLSFLEAREDTKIYYTHPYSSWERGSNERHNGLLRRFIPKYTSLKGYTQTQIYFISDRINGLPRKILDYNTPEQLFEKELDLIYAS